MQHIEKEDDDWETFWKHKQISRHLIRMVSNPS
jgi:hypothetical protein